MNKSAEQLTEQYSSCPSELNEYVEAGKKYIVTRYFTGDKKLNEIITELAVNRAMREMGL